MKYRDISPYQEFVSERTKSAEHYKSTEQEIRLCLNYGCKGDIKFKAVDNQNCKENHKFNCLQHPGKFNFGSLPTCSVKEACGGSQERSKPCWQCCGKTWDSAGCTRAYHSGKINKNYKKIFIFF